MLTLLIRFSFFFCHFKFAVENLISFLFFFFFFSFFKFFKLKDGRTPLFIAAHNGDEHIVQILLEKGEPNVNLSTKVLLFLSAVVILNWITPFFLSLSHFQFWSKFGRTPLFIAAREGYEQIVQILLEKGNPNVDLAMKVLLIY